MPTKKVNPKKDKNAETKIKDAARSVFHKKGFAATRTRDIAEEAGINLALLNYYFRSKEKLFQIIMKETMMQFMHSMVSNFNDTETTLNRKIELIADAYIDLMIAEPEIPLFILSEIRANINDFFDSMPLGKVLLNSTLVKQYKEAQAQGVIADLKPIQFIMNLMGLIVFPFVAAPMLKKIGDIEKEDYEKLMLQRKTLIPIWIESILQP